MHERRNIPDLIDIWLEKANLYLQYLLMSLFGAFLFIMMLILTVDALGRTFFNHPISGVSAVSTYYLMPAIAFIPLAYAQKHKAHVVVEIVGRFLPPSGQH